MRLCVWMGIFRVRQSGQMQKTQGHSNQNQGVCEIKHRTSYAPASAPCVRCNCTSVGFRITSHLRITSVYNPFAFPCILNVLRRVSHMEQQCRAGSFCVSLPAVTPHKGVFYLCGRVIRVLWLGAFTLSLLLMREGLCFERWYNWYIACTAFVPSRVISDPRFNVR